MKSIPVEKQCVKGDWTDTFWVMLANVLQGAGPFLALIIITRLHGLGQAGQFAYAQAVTIPVMQFLGFQLKALVLTHRSDEVSLSIGAGIRVLTSCAGALLIAFLALFDAWLICFWIGARLVDSWAEIFQADAQRSGQSRTAAFSLGSRTLCLLFAAAWADNAEMVAKVYFSLSLILLVVFDWQFRSISMHWNWGRLSHLMQRGFVLGIVLFLQAMSSSIPRIMLERSSDAATLGLFAALSVLLQTGNLIASGYGQALIVKLGSAPVSQLVVWMSLPFCLAVLALCAQQIAEPLILSALQVSINPSAHETLLFLGIAQLTIWPAAMIGYALTARRLYTELLWVGLSLVVVSATMSMSLIPTYGAAGAAMSLALTGLTTILMCFWFLVRSSARVGSMEPAI